MFCRPCWKIAGAHVEAEVLRRVDAEAAEEAVVRLGHVRDLDLVRPSGVQDLLRLHNRGGLEPDERIEVLRVELDLEPGAEPWMPGKID